MDVKLFNCMLLILSEFVVITTSTSCANQTENKKTNFPYYSSPSYNPVNAITINNGACCNETERDGHLQKQLNQMTSLLTDLISRLESGEFCCDKEDTTYLRDCYEIQQSGITESGYYTIQPDSSHPFEVYCDMDTDRGGWTVFQRRQDGSVDFYRDWQDYKNGFGSVGAEHWLGNENLYYLSNQKTYELRVELVDFENETRYAKYATFIVAEEADNYRLTIGAYTPGNAGDSMAICNGQQFSTRDADNDVYDGHCAERFKGGWWYESCHLANLNGLYLRGTHTSYADGINWQSWKGHNYSLKFSEMKLRPV